MNFNHTYDVWENAINQLAQVKDNLVNECLYYAQKPNPNPAYLSIKQKQIATIDGLLKVFTDVYNQFESAYNNVNINNAKLKNEVFALEAACLFYGLSPAEVNSFTALNTDQILQKIQPAIQQKWRQVPVMFQQFLNQANVNQAWQNLHIHFKNGILEYSTPEKQVKTANSPIFSITQLIP